MVELMSNYTIENLIHSSLDDIDEDTFILWVLHADKVPPHIGISNKGKFYSLKANGKDDGVEVSSIKSIIHRKRITTLCFFLKKTELSETLSDHFYSFDKTIPHKITCLDPIKNVFSLKEPRKLTELLDVLFLKGIINSIKGVYSNSFEGILEYDVLDIHSRLKKLSDAR